MASIVGNSWMRLWRLLCLVILAHACGDVAPPIILGWQAPNILLDQDYPNGHPLVINTPQNSSLQTLEDMNFQAVNDHRAALGLPPFTRDLAAEGLARAYSKHMTIEPFFAHLDPEGDYVQDRALKASGYFPFVKFRENLQWNTDPLPASIMQAFLNSPGHRASIEATDVNVMGLGMWYDSTHFRYYLAEEFFYR